MDITEITGLQRGGVYVLKVKAEPPWAERVSGAFAPFEKEFGVKFIVISDDIERVPHLG